MCPYFATLKESKLMGKSVGAMRCYQSDIKNMIFNKIQKNANPAIEGSWHGSGLFF